MNRFLLTLLALLLASAPAWGQMPAPSPQYCPIPPVDSTLTRGQAARDNLWPGFGAGSLRQADMTSAYAFRTADILGLSLTGVGAVGLAATALQRGVGGVSFFSSARSNAPYFIFGGVALAGLATLTTSRILAVRQAREYDLILFPAALPGGGGLTVSLQF